MKFEMKMKLNEWIKIRIEKVKVYDIDKSKSIWYDKDSEAYNQNLESRRNLLFK